MNQALERVQTPEESEYARYLAEIEVRKRRVAELRADIEGLRLKVGQFATEYHARVGVLFVERDRLRLSVEEYELRIVRLQAHPDREQAERDVAESFSERHEQIHEDEEEARRYKREYRNEQKRPPLDAATEADLKRLYRDLAKRFHPDLARTSEERQQREAMMRRVNAAFAERELGGLQTLMTEAEVSDPNFESRSIGEKLVWAIREVSRLDGLAESLTTEISVFNETDTFILWSRHDRGEPVVEMLEDDLRREMDQLRDRLSTLIATYRALLEEPR